MVILIIWISYSSFSNKISEVLTAWIIQIKMDTLTHPQPSKKPTRTCKHFFLIRYFWRSFYSTRICILTVQSMTSQSSLCLLSEITQATLENLRSNWRDYTDISTRLPVAALGLLHLDYTYRCTGKLHGRVTEWARVACRNSTTRSGRTWTGPWSSGGSTPGTRNVGMGRALGRGSIVFVLFFQNILFVWWMFIAVVFSTVWAKMEKCTMK